MFVFGFVPLFVIGTLAWIIVGAVRSRATAPFTPHTAGAIYGTLASLAGLYGAAAGAGLLVRYAISRLQLTYSYTCYGCQLRHEASYYGGTPLEDQARGDLLLGLTLLAVGGLCAGGHLLLARAIRRWPGGSPNWLTSGIPIALVVGFGAPGLVALAIGIYAWLSIQVLPASSTVSTQFGEAFGMAAAFLPIWAVALVMFMRRRSTPAPAAPVTVFPGPASGSLSDA